MHLISVPLLCIVSTYSITASESKSAEDGCLASPVVEIQHVCTHKTKTPLAEKLCVTFANKDYLSVSFDFEPAVYQSPYSGVYTRHDSVCLYKLQEHQAEQYYHHLKNMIEKKTIVHTVVRSCSIKQKISKRKQIPNTPFSMTLRSKKQK